MVAWLKMQCWKNPLPKPTELTRQWKKSKLVLTNGGKTVVFQDLTWIQAGSHVNIMFQRRTEVKIICGVSFIGLESPVWHMCSVLMLLQPYINKSFNDGIVLSLCRPLSQWCRYQRSLCLGRAWLARVSARRQGKSKGSGRLHLCECTLRPTKCFKWDKRMLGPTISECVKCFKTWIGGHCMS